MGKPVVAAPLAPTQPVVDTKTGRFNYTALKWAQNLTQAVNAGLDLLGQIIGNISASATVGDRTEGIGTTLNHITATGKLDSLLNVAADVNTDHIADGTGSPLAGGVVAHAALVASAPADGTFLKFTGGILGTWGAHVIAYADVSGAPAGASSNAPSVSHQWLDGYNSTTGFSQSQPAFSDISGTASAGQVPALSALSGTITTAQLPFTITSGSGAPSSTPADNSLYFDTSATPAHGYVRLSGTWKQFS